LAGSARSSPVLANATAELLQRRPTHLCSSARRTTAARGTASRAGIAGTAAQTHNAAIEHALAATSRHADAGNGIADVLDVSAFRAIVERGGMLYMFSPVNFADTLVVSLSAALPVPMDTFCTGTANAYVRRHTLPRAISASALASTLYGTVPTRLPTATLITWFQPDQDNALFSAPAPGAPLRGALYLNGLRVLVSDIPYGKGYIHVTE